MPHRWSQGSCHLQYLRTSDVSFQPRPGCCEGLPHVFATSALCSVGMQTVVVSGHPLWLFESWLGRWHHDTHWNLFLETKQLINSTNTASDFASKFILNNHRYNSKKAMNVERLDLGVLKVAKQNLFRYLLLKGSKINRSPMNRHYLDFTFSN